MLSACIPAPPSGFNDSGVVVGHIDNNGYIYDGALNLFSVPNSMSTAACGINDLGQVTGYYRTDAGYFGFIKTGDIFETLLPPWATSAHAYDINDSGHVVGTWYDQVDYGAFLYDGQWQNLGSDMQAFGINNLGTIVGKLDEGSLEHGFVISQSSAPIPEPATMLLLGSGLIGLAAFKRKH